MDTRQVILQPDPLDGGWIAEIPSLPGCVSDGDTPEDAIQNVKHAAAAWIDAAQHLGREVPPDTHQVLLLEENLAT